MGGNDNPSTPEPNSAADRLAAEVKRLRLGAGWSQVDLAARAGYTRQYVSHAEVARRNLPSLDLIQTLDNVLNASGSLLKLREEALVEQRQRRVTSHDRSAGTSRHHNTTMAQAFTSPAVREFIQTAIRLSDNSSPLNDGNATEVLGPDIAENVRRSQEQWIRVRRAPGAHGRELAELAAWLYPKSHWAPGGHALVGSDWLLDKPVELDSVRLTFTDAGHSTPTIEPNDRVLPLTARGNRYSSYSRAVRDLVRPRLLENRLSYRLLEISQRGGLSMTFGTTTFFEVFDVKEYLAHEFKAAWLASGGSVPSWDSLPLRQSVSDPFDPVRLLMSPGISTLTIRKDRRGEHRFVMHQRDGKAVADGGSMCTVMPSGEFQPSSLATVDVHNDFSLWRNIMREYSEEFYGNPEHDGSSARSINYAEEEPFRNFEQARTQGSFQLWHYGLVMDALTLGVNQQTVAVIDGDVFDQLFAGLVPSNDEGRVIGEGSRADLPFTSEAIDRLNPRLSASSLTLLRLAWRDRQILLAQ
ncbi:helix-turn-helix domain-containing protein [Actinosynnema sp. ALI-1.44]|uniref:helix-turn-helix domain-containing protein n=1 Tax=Actinosynnema sp. ALI-1.44 TaxID=1933779 RepID=UPI0009FD40F9|nr:helix-turn-helix transcriptional regulator [Actinosynnema sp. ALI-1.44]